MSDHWVEILASLSAALVAAVSAALAASARKHASEVNDAVNHTHKRGTPRLYDLALQNSLDARELLEWKRGYEGGPLDSGEKVEKMMAEFNAMKESCTNDCHSLTKPVHEDEVK